MIDKDIKYENSVPQLVKSRKDGKRPGYRGDAAYRSGSAQASSIGQGKVGSQSSFGDGPSKSSGGPPPTGGGNIVDEVALTGGKPPPTGSGNDGTITMENIGVSDLGGPTDIVLGFGNYGEFGPVTYPKAPTVFDLLTYDNQFGNVQGVDYSAVGPDSVFAENTRLRQELIDRPYEGVNTPFGAINAIGNFLGGLGYEVNKEHFIENVAGKKGYGYGYDDYKQYMQDRGLGKVDAYGNTITTVTNESDASNPLKNLLLAQQLANPTVPESQENLQGGVAQLYNQYMRNLGYTL